MTEAGSFVVFMGDHRVGGGSLVETAIAAKRATDGSARTATILNLETGEPLDLNLRGGFAEVRARYDAPPRPKTPGRGRPKLGVTAREVTLMPRHWDWLARQPGGASVVLRKLVEEASRNPKAQQRARRDAVYRFATAIVGNAPGYEEAMRALYAGQAEEF